MRSSVCALASRAVVPFLALVIACGLFVPPALAEEGEGASPTSLASELASSRTVKLPASTLAEMTVATITSGTVELGPAASATENAEAEVEIIPTIRTTYVARGSIYTFDGAAFTLVNTANAETTEEGYLIVPSALVLEGATYPVNAIAAGALSNTDVPVVALSSAVASIDEEAARGNEKLQAIYISPANEVYTSHDGCLYDTETFSLLLIPEGKRGAVRIAPSAENVDPEEFSHCPSVESISADAGSAALPALADVELHNANGEPIEVIIVDEDTDADGAEAVEDAQVDKATFDAATVVAASDGAVAGEPLDVEPIDPDAIVIPEDAFAPVTLLSDNADAVSADAELADDGEAKIGSPLIFLESRATYGGTMDLTLALEDGVELWKTNASGSSSTLQNEPVTMGCSNAAHVTKIKFESTSSGLVLNIYHNKSGDLRVFWVKPGYVLTGVRIVDSTGATETISASATGTVFSGTLKGKPRTVYPVFERITYSVSLDKAGGAGGADKLNDVRYDADLPAITPPTRAGYKFMGYYWGSNGKGTRYYDENGRPLAKWDRYIQHPESLSANVELGSSYRLIAYWVDSVTVKGGAGTLSTYNAHSEAASSWTESGLSEKVITDVAQPNMVYGGRTDRCIHYTVGRSSKAVYADPRSGYTFLGWDGVKKDGTTFTVDPSTGPQNVVIGATYTAKWGGPWSATFKANGGALDVYSAFTDSDPSTRLESGLSEKVATWSGSPNLVYSHGTVHYPQEDGSLRGIYCKRPGYTFLGWDGVRADGTTFTVDPSTGNKGLEPGATYTAKWGGPYSFTVKAGGGTLTYFDNASGSHTDGLADKTVSWPGEASQVFGDSYSRCIHWNVNSERNELKANRPGYTFLGWDGVRADGTTFTVDPSTGNKGLEPGATYTAKWGGPYSATFDGGGGTVSYQDVATGKKETAERITPSSHGSFAVYWDDSTKMVQFDQGDHTDWLVAERPGYTWLGWEGVRPDGSRFSVDADTGTQSGIPGATYTAKWRAPDAATFKGGGGTLYYFDAHTGKTENMLEKSVSWDGAAAIYGAGVAQFWVNEKLCELGAARPGYTLLGWDAVNPDGTTFTVDASTGTQVPKKGTIYTAKWGAPYTITVKADGGTMSHYDPVADKFINGLTSYTACWSEGSTLAYGDKGSRAIHWHDDGLHTLVANRTGYTFLGWDGVRADGTTFTVDSSTGNKGLEPGATYTAKWGGPWTTTFKANGGTIDVYSAYTNSDPSTRLESGLSEKVATWSGSPNLVYSHGTVHYPQEDGSLRGIYCKRSGYTFLGWDGVRVDGTTFTVDSSTGNKGLEPGATYTAKWGGPWSATFKANGGAIDVYSAFTDSDPSKKVESGLSEKTAVWGEGSHAVYSGRGGGVVHYSQEDGSLEGIYCKRPGYTFLGWDGVRADGTTFTVDAPVDSTASEPIVIGATYTAKWGGPYSATFDGGGGTVSYQNVATGKKETVERITPSFGSFRVFWEDSTKMVQFGIDDRTDWLVAERPGYTWLGWEGVRADGTRFSVDADTSTQSGIPGATYTAKWGGPYNVVVRADGGTMTHYDPVIDERTAGLADMTVTWTEGATRAYGNEGSYGAIHWHDGGLHALDVERPGYLFAGWAGVRSDSTPFTVDSSTGSKELDAGAVYTAKWTLARYSIDYELAGGSLDEPREDYTLEDEFDLPIPTRYGYRFIGWTVSGQNGTGIEADSNVSKVKRGTYGDLTCEANWALAVNVELPVTAAAGVSFELGVPDGDIRVAGTAADPKREAEGWLRSKMPVRIALDSIRVEGAPIPDEGASEHETFWATNAGFADLTVRAADGAEQDALTLTVGDDVTGGSIPESFSIPEATAADRLGERKLLYSLSLDRLFADVADGGAGVDIVDLLPDNETGTTLPTELLAVIFTVDVSKYA